MTRPTIQTDAGTEILCSKCNEYWPADLEFFYFSAGRPHSWCKACYASDPELVARRKRFAAKRTAQCASARVKPATNPDLSTEKGAIHE